MQGHLERRRARLLPQGSTLPEPVWRVRHAGIVAVLWVHVPALFVFALVMGESPGHGAVEAAAVAVWAVGATLTRSSRGISTLAASVGLLTASAVLVHLSGGVVEMHFHYFVMVGVVTLYQEWRPFLVAIGYVVVQHGVAGAISPESVYNHASAIEHPWAWAGVHGAFILGMSVAGIVSWRLNEVLLAAANHRQASLSEAQEVARLGSWELDRATGRAEWSPEMYRLLGVRPGDVHPCPEAFFACVHPDDHDRLRAGIATLESAGQFVADFRVVWGDGSVHWLHGRWRPLTDDRGPTSGVAGTLQDVTDRVEADAELRRTLSLLNATLDATADGILVVDLAGRIVSYNTRFAEMWGLPREVLDAGDDGAALAMVCSQLVDPDVFVGKVRELYAEPSAVSFDTLDFVDGRTVERHSMPQQVDDVVVGRVWSFRDITGHKRLEDELAHQAFHDSLTKLANKALFRNRLEHGLARAARRTTTLAVLFIDLDNFKTVNDSLGHTAGDALLVAVTERLLACVREEDTVARLGGDEFAILIEDCEEAADVAHRIMRALSRPICLADQELVISASVGIAFDEPHIHVEQLLRNADLAMYTAKRNGRARFEVYEAGMHAVAVERLALEGDLRRALGRDELVVHYQPMYDVAGEEIRVVEALVRWNHPTRGLVPPMAFIPMAEETGLIEEVGRFVLDQACQDTARLRRRPDGARVAVSVNLSPRQLLHATILDDVRGALARAELPADALVLEITEGAMMNDPEAATVTLHALRDEGVRLAIDDFGTGYSSLSYLQRFPIDIVKIDRSFVDKLDSGDDALVSAIVRMAQSMRLATVAEGVETARQLERLRDLGCDLVQGYHLARPQPLAELEDLVIQCQPRTQRASS